jgi:hypothetical protein
MSEGTSSMRRLLVVLSVALGALVAGPSALAAPPTHETAPVDDVFFDPSCGFLIEGHVTGVGIVIEWTNKDGSSRIFLANPQLKATLTNLDTGASITENLWACPHYGEPGWQLHVRWYRSQRVQRESQDW